MLIPHSENAFIDIRKLRDYCLNPDHDEGKHKAQLFLSILGITANDAEELRQILLKVVQTHDAQLDEVMSSDSVTRSISCLSVRIEVQSFGVAGSLNVALKLPD